MSLIIPRQTVEKFFKIEDVDQYKAAVFKELGKDLEKIEVLLNRVLVAVYIENEYMHGGKKFAIAKTVDNAAESIWQGKAALVLKCGPLAFADDTHTSFANQTVKPGNWVSFKIGNSSQIELKKIPCRIVMDQHIEAIYHDPRIVTS